MKPGRVVASVQGEGKPPGESTVAEVKAQNSLAVTVERFTARMERLESECEPATPYKQYGGSPAMGGGRGMGPPVGRSILWKCLTTWYEIDPRTGHRRETSCPRCVC